MGEGGGVGGGKEREEKEKEQEEEGEEAEEEEEEEEDSKDGRCVGVIKVIAKTVAKLFTLKTVFQHQTEDEIFEVTLMSVLPPDHFITLLKTSS